MHTELKMKTIYRATVRATGEQVRVYLTNSGRMCNYTSPTISYEISQLRDFIEE